MSGATVAAAALGGGTGGASGGSDVTPDALNWSNANGDVIAFTNSQTLAGINAQISIKVAWTGNAKLQVNTGAGFAAIANGDSFTASNGDAVSFGVQNVGAVTTGTVTITNLSDSSTVLDTFTYTVTRIFI